jgi:hypothetical protein
MKRIFFTMIIVLLASASALASGVTSQGGSSSSGSTLTEVDVHASGNITADQMKNTTMHNVGQVADSAQALADFAAGMKFSAKPSVAASKYLRLTPSATANYNVICMDGTCCGAGKYWGWTTVVGNEAISCESQKTATGYRLFCSEISGIGACEP